MQKLLNHVKALSLDQIFHAGLKYEERSLSGVEILSTLFFRHYKALFLAPKWSNRDRFVMCDGANTMVYYALLSCLGFISTNDLRDYTKAEGKTPLYPQLRTNGVDCDLGSPDQSFANAVGMALAERVLGAKLKNCSSRLVDHYTFCYADNNIMNSYVTSESMKLAAEYQLNKLIVLFNAYTEPAHAIIQKFSEAGWGIIEIADGNDYEKVDKAILSAKDSSTRPTIIIFNTKEDLSLELSYYHNKLIDKYSIVRLKRRWEFGDSMFQISPQVEDMLNQIKAKVSEVFVSSRLEMDQKGYPLLEDNQHDKEARGEVIYDFCATDIRENASTFEVSKRYLNSYIHNYPKTVLIIGNSQYIDNAKMQPITPENLNAQYIDMSGMHTTAAAVACGMSLHRGLPIVLCDDLLHAESMLQSLRRACVMNLPIKCLFVEDNLSIANSTRQCQPSEQVEYLRAMSNMLVYRPCDSVELAISMEKCSKVTNPSSIIVSTSPASVICRDVSLAVNGAYIVQEEFWNADGIFYTSGTEVKLCIKARKRLLKFGYNFIVVSVPCLHDFEQNKESYRNKIYSANIPIRIIVERTSGISLSKFLLSSGTIISSQSSTMGEMLYDDIDNQFTIDNIVKTALLSLQKQGQLKQPLIEIIGDENFESDD